MLFQMCPKKSKEFDETPENLIETELTDDLSRDSSNSSINPDLNSNSAKNSLTSSSSSSSASTSPVIFCENHNPPFKNEQNNNKQNKAIHFSYRKLINYESVSSLSVSSSPESHSFHHKGRERDVNAATQNIIEQVPRTVPCVVLSPSTHPHQHNHHPMFNPSFFNNPSSLIMPLPMFQSNILSKLSSLPTRNSELGIQRFQDFCVDQNSNNPTLPNNNTNNIKLYEEASALRKSKIHAHEKSLENSATKRLSFGIDRILSDENSEPGLTSHKLRKETLGATGEQAKDHISKPSDTLMTIPRQPTLHHPHGQHQNSHAHSSHPPNNNSNNPINLSRCSDCYFLGRYCRNNSNLQQYSSLLVNSSASSVGNGGHTNGISASFPPWLANASIYENSPLLSPSAYHHHPQSSFSTGYDLGPSNYSSLVSCNTSSGVRRKRSWSRAVFSSLQRKGLEKRFQIQKYITKPDRRQLAATLGLTDAQVKVWFQNRRMKWRHSKEGKVTSGVGDTAISTSSTPSTTPAVSTTTILEKK